MDRNKKITGILFAGIITLAITACKLQPQRYISLYVDNLTSVNDTIDPGEVPLYMADTSMTNLVDTASVIEAELPVFLPPAEEMSKISPDSAYQHEVKELLKAITDSIQLLHRQIVELQNQHVFMPDTNFPGKRLYKVQPLDSLQPEVKFKQLIQVKNDTIAMLHDQEIELRKTAGQIADTVYIEKEAKELQPVKEL